MPWPQPFAFLDVGVCAASLSTAVAQSSVAQDPLPVLSIVRSGLWVFVLEAIQTCDF